MRFGYSTESLVENINELKELVSCDKTVLILTEPICDMETRARIFKDISAEYEKEWNIVIKPHPNDFLDYITVFPNNIIIERRVPMEMFHFIHGLMFDKAIGVYIPANGIHFAKECIRLGVRFMDKYEDPDVHKHLDNF